MTSPKPNAPGSSSRRKDASSARISTNSSTLAQPESDDSTAADWYDGVDVDVDVVDDDHDGCDDDDDDDEDEGTAEMGSTDGDDAMADDVDDVIGAHDDWVDDDDEVGADTMAPDDLELNLGRLRSSLGQGFRGGMSSKYHHMLKTLKSAAHDPPMRLMALQKLAESLSMATEVDLLNAFPMQGLLMELLWTLGGPEPGDHVVSERDAGDDDLLAALAASTGGAMDDVSIEAQLYACRCLTYMLEVMPASAHSIYRRGGIPILIAKLHDISFIDLAEQVLQTLEKLSNRHAFAIIPEGGMLAMLQYIDFFGIHVQRTAMSSVANCCRSIAPMHAKEAREIVPIVRQVLSHSDARLVESACECVCSLTKRMADEDKVLDQLLPDLLPPVCALLARGLGSDTSNLPRLKDGTCTELLEALAQAARKSASLAKILFEHGILNTMYTLFTGAPPTMTDVPQPALLRNMSARSSEQIKAALRLLQDMLPPLPCDGIFDSKAYTQKAYTQKKKRAERAQCTIGELDAALDDTPARRLSAAMLKQQRAIEARAETQRAWPGFFERCASLLLPVLLHVYTLSRSFGCGQMILTTILRELWYTDTTTLSRVLEPVPLASFLAGVLSSREEPAFVEAALQAVELLVVRVPYLPHLIREGVVHTVACLANEAEPNYRAKLVHARLEALPDDADVRATRDRAAKLRALAKSITTSTVDLGETLASMADLLPNITIYELQEAGLVDALYACASESDERRDILRKALWPVHATLLECLQANLSRVEELHVASAGGLESLTRHIDLRLEADKATAEHVPKQYRSLYISTHAIVTVKSLHSILKPRLELALSAKTLLGMMSEQGEESASDSESEDESRTYASAAQSAKGAWHMVFEMNGVRIPPDATLYSCVQGQSDEPYTLQYKIVRGRAPKDKEQPRAVVPDTSADGEGAFGRTLRLLGVLHDLWEASGVPDDAFVNTKLTAKLAQQLDEPLILASACMPSWARTLPVQYGFLFPFDMRLQYLRQTGLGFARLLNHYKKSCGQDDLLALLAHLPRQKVRISRQNMLECATKVMALYAKASSVLEVEYFDELGSGLGPTLEFYTLVSREFQRTSLGMWRSVHDEEYVQAGDGLFPAVSMDTGIARHFRTLGQFVAKSVLDMRMIDVPFHPLFWQAVLHRPMPRTLATLERLDATLARSLRKLLEMPGTELDALAMDYTMPGTEWRLGQDDTVTPNNVHAYVQAVVDTVLSEGIANQLESFRDGFESVLSLSTLHVFSSRELSILFGQSTEDWDEATLRRTVVPDHGLSSESPTFTAFLSILAEFDARERRVFLQWLTGSPRLPIGGFAALQPPLTVVHRQHEPPLEPDNYLPSVMTCANYLKLPSYSSRAIMKQRLCTAMQEGGTSFLLS